MGVKSPLFVRKQAGGMFSVTDETTTTGNHWYVDSGSATGKNAAGYGQNPDSPVLTWDYAVGLATASNGDVIHLMPGHAETLTTAGAVTLDKIGVTTIGIGEGALRPTFTFTSTDNTASVLITAASNKIKNIIGVCGDDGLTNPFHVQAADCELDIEWKDASSTVEAAVCVFTNSSADRLKVKLKYIGFPAGDAAVSAIQLVGVNDALIDIDAYGKWSVSIIDMLTTACTNININGYFYVSGTTDLSKDVTAHIGSCTWFVHGFDGAAGYEFQGGSGMAVAAAPDLASVASQATSIATGVVSVGAQVLSAATSVGVGTSTINSNIVGARSQATSIATGAVSVGAQASVLASQITSMAIGLAATLSIVTSKP